MVECENRVSRNLVCHFPYKPPAETLASGARRSVDDRFRATIPGMRAGWVSSLLPTGDTGIPGGAGKTNTS